MMSFFSFIFLMIAWLQNIFYFSVFQANHVTFIILTSMIYLFTETLIIFFFVGTGVSIKEYTQEHKLPTDYHKRSIQIKRIVYPPQLLNMLYMMIIFILVGAVDVGKFPAWLYQTLFFLSIIHFLIIKKVQHQCFRENTKLVLEMSGISPKY